VADSSFTEWKSWRESPQFDPESFLETLDGGQSFSWNRKESYLEGSFKEYLYRLKLEGNTLSISIPQKLDYENALAHLGEYFALKTDFQGIIDTLPWRSDQNLKRAIEAYPNLRILKQPLNEALFGFLCSSTKQIPQIKEMFKLTAQKYGPEVHMQLHALPNWDLIAQLEETDLRKLKLGYRARYIHKTAQKIKAEPDWLNSLHTMDTDQAKKELLSLPGVGSKIADCVLLFSLGRLESFPIDTWIAKILKRAYGLEGFSNDQLQAFSRNHYGPYAGYAQQFLFSAARSGVLKL